jgi:hypothetical protein
MAANGISTLSTKAAKQNAKLDLAQLKRQGYTLNSAGTVVSGPDITKTFYRVNNNYDINLLPNQYVGNVTIDNDSPLLLSRPWIPLPSPQFDIILENGDVLTLESGLDDFVTE